QRVFAVGYTAMRAGSFMLPAYTQLTPNLYVAQSRLFHTNQGIFVSEGQACLVDPGIYPDEIEAIARFVSKQSASAQAIILPHTHAPGHAADQLTLYHPETATLWAADMLSDLEIPFVSHDLDAYQLTLAALASWDIRVLIPGHGHTTTNPQEIQARLSEDIAY